MKQKNIKSEHFRQKIYFCKNSMSEVFRTFGAGIDKLSTTILLFPNLMQMERKISYSKEAT